MHSFGTNSFYFLCAPYFYDKIDKAGLFEFNPYEKDSVSVPFPMKNNPGFIPDGYFSFTQNFNVYVNENYSHEGVDFAGTKDTVIKSLIFGEVIDVGTHKKVHDGTGMGDYMIVQDAYDKNKYYLLLHLAYESWKKYNISIGTKVYPGMKVAGVGKQDYSETAYHLHISVAVLLPSEKAIPEDDKKGPVIIRDSNYLFPIWGYNAKMRDPFNHKITWKGRS